MLDAKQVEQCLAHDRPSMWGSYYYLLYGSSFLFQQSKFSSVKNDSIIMVSSSFTMNNMNGY